LAVTEYQQRSIIFLHFCFRTISLYGFTHRRITRTNAGNVQSTQDCGRYSRWAAAFPKKNAIERVRRIRRLPEHKHLSFICDSLTNISEYAKVSNHAYKVIRRLIPGPFTFILPATKAVPHYAVDPKRKTTGIRVPDSPIALALLKELENPLISITAKHDDQEFASPEELIEALAPLVDVVITPSVYTFLGESTVIDMTQEEFHLVRRGAGIDEALIHLPELIEE
jgi:tRNA threonylcarbamoyl adenosine modification protein (Sua5/YciO/YrdC/YwlC family)